MNDDRRLPQGEIPEGVIERIKIQAGQWAALLDHLDEQGKTKAAKAYEMGARAEFHHWNPSYPKQGHPVYKGWDSIKLIGRSRERHQELVHKEWDWRAFYNGWLEGRADMLKQFAKDWDQMEELQPSAEPGDTHGAEENKPRVTTDAFGGKTLHLHEGELPDNLSEYEMYKAQKEAIENKTTERRGGKEERKRLIDFLDWWLLNYLGSKGATPNSSGIVVDRFIRESKSKAS